MEKEEWKEKLDNYNYLNEQKKIKKIECWEASIGLQEVDGLKPSSYLLELVKDNIDGKITINDTKKKINNYYKAKKTRNNEENEEEADKVSVRIADILDENTFNFSITELLNIHKKLFDGIYESAGTFRKFNFTKKEWVLNGDTVIYSSYEIIKESLIYDFKEEKEFCYKNLSKEEIIKHISRFISNIWQIHPFEEGNTRTTAIFLIKYLRNFGFDVDYKIFKDNSWYFRNALVRANYNNVNKNIFENTSYLEKFLYNMLIKNKYKLKNQYLNIDYKVKEKHHKSNLSNEKGKILNIIKENSQIKQEEIAININKSIRMVKIYMKEMQNESLIKRKGSKKSGTWVILKDK